MHNIRKTLFISDLHLDENHPEIASIFLQFLQNTAPLSDALYILGDLFEAWIGDDDLSPFHQSIIHALHDATSKGLPIYFIHGNRDFLISDAFLQATGCQLLAEETVIDLYGTRVLLMHGDTLCTHDRNYLRVRKKLRHPFIQKLFLLLPLFLRRKIANRMRAKSQGYTQSAPHWIMDVADDEVQRVLGKHRLELIIHGHTHRPAFHAARIVLAAWHTQGNMLAWDNEGNKELINFS